MTTPLADLTATEARRRIVAGTLRRETLLEACLERIARDEERVRAFAWFDADAARSASPRPGPLHGLPLGVKDVLDTADMPTACNSPLWAGNRPRADAGCVAWAREAGAVVIGKTVTTEFATRHPGPTTNPHGATRTPGGSSSGSAAGVAAGFFPLAFGTQTAGSVIRPAAYCGVWGFKPSFGLIPRTGHKLMSDTLDTVGTFGRSAADCALLAGAASRRDFGPATAPEAAPRVGLCRGPAWDRAAAPETHAVMERAAAAVVRAGAVLSDWELPDPAGFEDAHAVVMNHESALALGWEMTTGRDRISSGLLERMDWGLSQDGVAADAAASLLARHRESFAVALGGFDVLLTPAAPGEAPEGLGWTGDAGFNLVWTALHVPCVSVPAGVGPNGMPLAVQVVGRRGADAAVLAWADWVARALAA